MEQRIASTDAEEARSLIEREREEGRGEKKRIRVAKEKLSHLDTSTTSKKAILERNEMEGKLQLQHLRDQSAKLQGKKDKIQSKIANMQNKLNSGRQRSNAENEIIAEIKGLRVENERLRDKSKKYNVHELQLKVVKLRSRNARLRVTLERHKESFIPIAGSCGECGCCVW